MHEDLISRAEAIRIASGYCHAANIVKELEKLPSVQPKERCIANVTINEEDLEKIVKEQVEEIKTSLGIIRCKDCKFSHMTYNGECKYCDIWFPDEKMYLDGDYFCADAELREGDAE